MPDQANLPERPHAVPTAVPPKDDIVGWPDGLLIVFPDSLTALVTPWRTPTD
jgi:hypothetical protein